MQPRWAIFWAIVVAIASAGARPALAQDEPLTVAPDDGTRPFRLVPQDADLQNSPTLVAKEDAVIESVEGPEVRLVLDLGLATLVRTRSPVSRISIAQPGVVDVIQYGPTEFEFIGRSTGQTSMTLWFGQPGPNQPTLRYLVQVGPGQGVQYRQQLREFYYGELERRINALFPYSSIQLIPVLERLLVRGQARDPQQAAQILSFLQNQAPVPGTGAIGRLGTAIDPSDGEAGIGTSQLIDMLEVPGEQNIMLKVRVAELQRSASRSFAFGYNVTGTSNNVDVDLGINSGTITAVLDSGQVNLFFQALEGNTMNKSLAEPNLVTINGGAASFIVGGAFPVPTVVGVGGVGAATTNFRGFGTQVFFQPVVIDKDRIRLRVSTSVSALAPQISVGGVPGTTNQAVQTIVDLREGQWLAVGGLISDTYSGGKDNIPFIGTLPLLEYFFSTKSTSRAETEVVILVSPELVRPMDAENVPLMLPGMDVTEPTNWDFYVRGRYEGRAGVYHRSTVWNEYKHRMRDALRDARGKRRYLEVQQRCVTGIHGFSH